jgi:hypothetical protein
VKSEIARKTPNHLFLEDPEEQPEKPVSDIGILCIFMAD